MRYAIVEEKTLTVVNVIEYDGVSNWEPPRGCTLVEAPIAGIGDIYDPESRKFYQDILNGIMRN